MSDQTASPTSPEHRQAMGLLQQRQDARQLRDFAAADALRAQIEHLGFLVVDTAEGPQLRPKPAYEVHNIAAGFPAYAHDAVIAVTVIVDGWLDDVREFVSRFISHEPDSMHLLLVDTSGDDQIARGLEDIHREHQRVTVVHTTTGAGWADVHAASASACQAPHYAVADMSTLIDGPVFESFAEILEQDAQVMAAGWRGANVDREDGWRSVVDAGAGDCDVLLSYLMVVRTSDARQTPPHPKAKFYRNADIEWSLRLRDSAVVATGRPPRMVALGSHAPMHQGRHHGYHDSDPESRDRESRKTYDRILTAFRGRTELLAP